MAQRPLWWLTVNEKAAVSPELWRVRLTGPQLADFPPGREGDYIKFLLPKDPSTDIKKVDPGAPDLSPFHKRSFTICEFDAGLRLLTIFITRHAGQKGPAARWAERAERGEEVLITGPGPVDQVDSLADQYLLAADLPGLGGVVANLRRLPRSASGHLVFESSAPIALIEEALPKNFTVHWVKPGGYPARRAPPLVEAVEELPRPLGKLGVWAACEYSSMKLLRDFFMGTLGLDKSQFYLSSYFKFDSTDEQHKQTRRDEGYKD